MTKLLVVDELTVLRQHIIQLAMQKVQPVPEIAEAASSVQALKIFRNFRPDIIAVDIATSEVSGLQLVKQIWSSNPAAKILFWTQSCKEAHIRELDRIIPKTAVHSYVLKSESDEKLAYALVSLIAHDNSYITPAVKALRLENKDNLLSDVEYETLQDIALGLTDKAIASRRHISVRGVQNRLSMLSAKLFKGEDLFLKENAGMEIYNSRTRLVLEGMKRGLIDADQIAQLELELNQWLAEEFDYQKS